MCKIYKNGLLPTAENHFDFGLSPWKLQEDNDPKHLSKLAIDWKVDNDVERMDWPAMSPDLAPIENVWQVLKMNLRKKELKEFDSLVAAIKEEWNKLPTEFALRLVQSMEKRVSEVIVSEGDFILY